MLRVWNDCKLSAKLQIGFAIVIVIFVAALGSAFALNDSRLIPAQMAMLRAQLTARRIDDDGAHYVMERKPQVAAAYLAHYRRDVAVLMPLHKRAT